MYLCVFSTDVSTKREFELTQLLNAAILLELGNHLLKPATVGISSSLLLFVHIVYTAHGITLAGLSESSVHVNIGYINKEQQKEEVYTRGWL